MKSDKNHTHYIWNVYVTIILVGIIIIFTKGYHRLLNMIYLPPCEKYLHYKLYVKIYITFPTFKKLFFQIAYDSKKFISSDLFFTTYNLFIKAIVFLVLYSKLFIQILMSSFYWFYAFRWSSQFTTFYFKREFDVRKKHWQNIYLGILQCTIIYLVEIFRQGS